MPAEWEPHAATWLAWPHKEASWPGKLDRIPSIFVEMIRHLVPGEHVHLNLNDEDMEKDVRARLQHAQVPMERVHFHRIPTNDAWERDHGAIFVVREQDVRSEQAIIDWGYNAWGGKYPPYDLDDVVPTRIGAELGLPVFQPPMILEGGSIDVNGTGSLLTTEACLLHPNRNPSLTKEQIEANLRDYLGVRNILWLGDGIVGDDTDGHIDDLARFIKQDTVVTVVEDNRQDENYEPLRANLMRLHKLRDEEGNGLRIYQLPMPDPVEYDGQRLPASYANFYIGNEVVLLPFYNCRSDQRVQQILEVLFPGRRVIGMDCTDLVWGLGAFHCLTQQQPQ